MAIAVGFHCLVVVVVLEGVTGIPGASRELGGFGGFGGDGGVGGFDGFDRDGGVRGSGGLFTSPLDSLGTGATQRPINGGFRSITSLLSSLGGDSCSVDGDPHIFTFDRTNFLNPANKYLFRGQGSYVITQNALSRPTFGVNAEFRTCNGPSARLTCVHSVTYYEQRTSINLVLPRQDISQTFPPYCSNRNAVKEQQCQIKVFVNGRELLLGESAERVPTTNGEVWIFKRNHIRDQNDLLCVNVVGSHGISVSLCERKDNFANLYVFAVRNLKKQPVSELYGLCNTYTGNIQDGFTTNTGVETQNVNDFGNTWRA